VNVRSWLVPAFLSAALGVCAGQPANLSGNWHLNIEKSHWGNKVKPQSVALFIEHQEPVLRYSGTVTHVNEDTRDFTFDGAIDGQPYSIVGSGGAGTIVLRRVDENTFESVFRNTDNTCTETARTTRSRDGHLLTRQIRLQTPEGTLAWTEVYERH
jgi:hypothetical protein